MASEIAICGQLAALFPRWAKMGNHGGKPWQSKIAHLMVVRYEAEKKEGGKKQGSKNKRYLSKACPPPVTYFLQAGPPT